MKHPQQNHQEAPQQPAPKRKVRTFIALDTAHGDAALLEAQLVKEGDNWRVQRVKERLPRNARVVTLGRASELLNDIGGEKLE